MVVAGKAGVGDTGVMHRHILRGDQSLRDGQSLLDGQSLEDGQPLHGGEFLLGWPVVLARFCLAVFAWDFGFYGQSVYLAALRETRGWSTALISAAATTYYLWGAILLAVVPRVIERFGVRGVAVSGALLLGAGTIALSHVSAPWQLYASALVMGVGWACTSTAVGAIGRSSPP